jgi:RNA 2',3'-cyclic 3'-phosphodiesterase
VSEGHQAHVAMRMFAAVWPDETTRRRLSLLELGPAPGLRLVGPDQWHVTLRFFGDVDDDLMPGLLDALTRAAATVGSVRCEVGPATAWLDGGRVLHVPVAGLDAVARAVREATGPIVPDLESGPRPFTGHLTVARSRRGRRDGPDPAALAGVPFVASFDVEAFDLVASELTPEGPRYTTLARLTLPK